MIGIEVISERDDWRRAMPDAQSVAERIFMTACKFEPSLKGGVALLLSDDEQLRLLNERFLDKNKPTNVLSFPSGQSAPDHLGDIALAFGACKREAAQKGVALHAHAAHLMVHGMLHLVGYDHTATTQARRMESMEIQILEAIGVANPYENMEPIV